MGCEVWGGDRVRSVRCGVGMGWDVSEVWGGDRVRCE